MRCVSNHVACLLIMFLNGRLAMPLERRENVRHATLLFSAFGGGPWQMSKAVGKKRLMATIKAMVAEKLRQEGRSADDNTIKGIVHRYLKDICRFFPDETSESKEFMGVLSEFRVNANSGATNEENAEALMERTINALLEKIMYERHDLCDEKYKNLREKLIESITKNWRN